MVILKVISGDESTLAESSESPLLQEIKMKGTKNRK